MTHTDDEAAAVRLLYGNLVYSTRLLQGGPACTLVNASLWNLHGVRVSHTHDTVLATLLEFFKNHSPVTLGWYAVSLITKEAYQMLM